jgi:hypothetical protein
MSLIILKGSSDIILFVLQELSPVSDPASHSRNGEQNHKHISRETQGFVNASGVEIDVGVKLSLKNFTFLWMK